MVLEDFIYCFAEGTGDFEGEGQGGIVFSLFDSDDGLSGTASLFSQELLAHFAVFKS